ncbi:unnamed protein product, partial [Amoebophrya sp. A25]
SGRITRGSTSSRKAQKNSNEGTSNESAGGVLSSDQLVLSALADLEKLQQGMTTQSSSKRQEAGEQFEFRSSLVPNRNSSASDSASIIGGAAQHLNFVYSPLDSDHGMSGNYAYANAGQGRRGPLCSLSGPLTRNQNQKSR